VAGGGPAPAEKGGGGAGQADKETGASRGIKVTLCLVVCAEKKTSVSFPLKINRVLISVNVSIFEWYFTGLKSFGGIFRNS
jgi:hypothetical protein